VSTRVDDQNPENSLEKAAEIKDKASMTFDPKLREALLKLANQLNLVALSKSGREEN
jgi:hypothetical protein